MFRFYDQQILRTVTITALHGMLQQQPETVSLKHAASRNIDKEHEGGFSYW